MRLWDPDGGALLHALHGHKDGVRALAVPIPIPEAAAGRAIRLTKGARIETSELARRLADTVREELGA